MYIYVSFFWKSIDIIPHPSAIYLKHCQFYVISSGWMNYNLNTITTTSKVLLVHWINAPISFVSSVLFLLKYIHIPLTHQWEWILNSNEVAFNLTGAPKQINVKHFEQQQKEKQRKKNEQATKFFHSFRSQANRLLLLFCLGLVLNEGIWYLNK